MKVKINQTVDLSEIPVKIREILQESHSQIDGLSDKSISCLDVADLRVSHIEKYELLLKCILSIRTELSELDQVMADLASLLEGYMGVIAKDQEAPANTAAPVPPQPRESSDADQG